MDWFKVNSTGILRGSLATAPDTTQIVWIKLLAIANETRDRDGYLRFAEGKPYPLTKIADICNVPLQDLLDAIAEFLSDVRDGVARIELMDDGTIKLNNWQSYQEVPDNKKKLSARELELVERKKIHQLAEKYPNEAMATPSVRKKIDDMLKGVK